MSLFNHKQLCDQSKTLFLCDLSQRFQWYIAELVDTARWKKWLLKQCSFVDGRCCSVGGRHCRLGSRRCCCFDGGFFFNFGGHLLLWSFIAILVIVLILVVVSVACRFLALGSLLIVSFMFPSFSSCWWWQQWLVVDCCDSICVVVVVYVFLC